MTIFEEPRASLPGVCPSGDLPDPWLCSPPHGGSFLSKRSPLGLFRFRPNAKEIERALVSTAGLYLIPSFRLSEAFDDNIFGSSVNRESDFISRFSPGLQGGYNSDPFTLLLRGGFEADVFAKHPELNDPITGWNAGVNFR